MQNRTNSTVLHDRNGSSERDGQTNDHMYKQELSNGDDQGSFYHRMVG